MLEQTNHSNYLDNTAHHDYDEFNLGVKTMMNMKSAGKTMSWTMNYMKFTKNYKKY